VGCYAQLKPEELAAVDGVDLVLGATEKFKITDYIDLSKNDFGEVHSCEIADADFYGKLLDRREPCFLESAGWLRLQM
jgi:threonylcarbamoyladenosine tRNA methylthiotransferase MtaB